MFEVRKLREEDFDYISPRIDEWWGGRNMFTMLPRLWFKDFAETSFTARTSSGHIIGFLVGYISPKYSEKGYIHFVGVDPEYRKAGVGRLLYEKFTELVKTCGCTHIDAVTHPENRLSLAFHESMGFLALNPDETLVPPTLSSGVVNYDGAGEDRVLLRRRI
jgi:ribosomal protein S18 acetylase RimI-like enzyme